MGTLTGGFWAPVATRKHLLEGPGIEAVGLCTKTCRGVAQHGDLLRGSTIHTRHYSHKTVYGVYIDYFSELGVFNLICFSA